MGIEDSVQNFYLLSEGLNSELGAGVHDPGSIIALDID
jgi:hypothetical protein